MRLSNNGKINGGDMRHVYVDIPEGPRFVDQTIKFYWSDGTGARSLELPLEYLKAVVRLAD